MTAALHVGTLPADGPHLDELKPGRDLQCLCRQLHFAANGQSAQQRRLDYVCAGVIPALVFSTPGRACLKLCGGAWRALGREIVLSGDLLQMMPVHFSKPIFGLASLENPCGS